MPVKTPVGFVGLGIMGRGMAENLLRAGYAVTVWNRTRAKAEQLRGLGAAVAESPAESAAGAAVVITMLSDPAAIAAAVLGQGGVIEGLSPSSVLVDCSTVDPATTEAVRKAAEARGAEFLDSPVGGSKEAAAKGELILLVGGRPETLEKARPILEVISKRIIHAGQSGSGTMLKLCFNLTASHMMAALAEALTLGVKGGLKPETILEALMSAAIGSPFYEWKGRSIIERDFTTNFSTRLMSKDLGLISSAGNSLGVPLPVTAAVNELFTMAKNHGLAEEDFSAVIKALEDAAGVVVGE